MKNLIDSIRMAMKLVAAPQSWKDEDFSVEKAYVAALYAELAYANVPQFELEQSKRVKIVPSMLYQYMIEGGQSVDVRGLILESGFSENTKFFTVSNRGAVAVGIKTNTTIFVAVRGTQKFYDHVIDLRAKMIYPYTGLRVGFHAGFFETIMELRWEIIKELRKWGENLPVILTGHSLGGAMAAILNSSNEFRDYWHPYWSTSCFTLGMPRYGNNHATCMSRQPFHIYNTKDLVPRLPPKFLGYHSPQTRTYCIQTGLVPDVFPDKQSLFSYRISEHYIDKYLSGIRALLSTGVTT